jgi:transposase
MEAFFGKLAPTEVVIEACSGAHHWGRLLTRLGHRVRLIPAQYVKPFVKRAKNDRADAEAIREAAARPAMPSVAVKSAEQQADSMILRHREMLIAQRTAAINALRGHAGEFGIIAAKGHGAGRGVARQARVYGQSQPLLARKLSRRMLRMAQAR